jgi:predicted nucleic acid-binding protein
MRTPIFLDSSIIVKGLKKDNTALEMIKLLVKVIDKVEPCINVIVLSETIYQLTYKRKFSLEELEAFLTRFRFLEVGRSIGNLALKYMKFYKLKPNDVGNMQVL